MSNEERDSTASHCGTAAQTNLACVEGVSGLDGGGCRVPGLHNAFGAVEWVATQRLDLLTFSFHPGLQAVSDSLASGKIGLFRRLQRAKSSHHALNLLFDALDLVLDRVHARRHGKLEGLLQKL